MIGVGPHGGTSSWSGDSSGHGVGAGPEHASSRAAMSSCRLAVPRVPPLLGGWGLTPPSRRKMLSARRVSVGRPLINVAPFGGLKKYEILTVTSRFTSDWVIEMLAMCPTSGPAPRGILPAASAKPRCVSVQLLARLSPLILQ